MNWKTRVIVDYIAILSKVSEYTHETPTGKKFLSRDSNPIEPKFDSIDRCCLTVGSYKITLAVENITEYAGCSAVVSTAASYSGGECLKCFRIYARSLQVRVSQSVQRQAAGWKTGI